MFVSKVKTVEDRIFAAHYRIMKSPEFCAVAGLLMTGKWEVKDGVPTAYVNASGNRVFGRKFMDSLPDKEVAFVVLHEIGHLAFMHLQMWKKLFDQNAQLANIAADHVVNNWIKQCDPTEKIAICDARRWCCDPKYIGWNVKQVFDDLLKNGGGKGSGEVLDEHDPTLEEGDKEGPEQDFEKAVQEIVKQVENALRTGNYLAGKTGGGQARGLTELLEPKIDWRTQFAEFLLTVCQGDENATWRRPNRRFLHSDTYLPGSQGEAMGELVLAVDTSGSVGGNELRAMLSEVVGICGMVKPSRVRLIYWSSGVEREEVYEQDRLEELASATKPAGGGGTVLEPVADYVRSLKDPVQTVVILTDCGVYGGWGDWGDVPVLVVSTTRAVAPIGKTIHLEI